MATTREQAITALLTIFEGIGALKTVSRRNRDPEGMDPALTPALFLLENEDDWDRNPGYNQFPIRSIMMMAIVYSDVGQDENAIPGTPINNALDAIEAALVPDNPQTGTMTLGGLVQAVTIDGHSQRSSGDTTG